MFQHFDSRGRGGQLGQILWTEQRSGRMASRATLNKKCMEGFHLARSFLIMGWGGAGCGVGESGQFSGDISPRYEILTVSIST